MTISDKQVVEFQTKLLSWYKENGRHFPWRNKSATNYQKIVSEVLLQRTKAVTIAKFFPKFIRKYPSWKQLGNATEEELQESLRPIGLYKQRGSRLFKLAQELKKRKGRFPKERSEVEELPMMGQYITNAYELFILKKSSPLLDVNMARVIERYFGQRKLSDIRYDPYLQDLAHKLVTSINSYEINWAIIDFAASICKARDPKCPMCSLNKNCKFITQLP
ncbi:MAG: hypothetical protein H8D45_16170 [Bacteroidetes bacterium]|nr:hypothetical protein [Bacteroidota bacterium]MBL7103165.1 hypothetical protein [Bacteroidales bacterium]